MDQFPGLVCVAGHDAARAGLEPAQTYEVGQRIVETVPERVIPAIQARLLD